MSFALDKARGIDLLQMLEPRLLLSADAPVGDVPAELPDLAVSVSRLTFPDHILPGTRGKVVVTLHNEGLTKARGRSALRLYLSADGVLDEGDVLLYNSIRSVSMLPGAVKNVSIRTTVPQGMAEGDYSILAQLEPLNFAETTADNNVGGLPVFVEAPVVDLVAEFQRVNLPAQLNVGTRGWAYVTVENLGNIRARGRADVRLVLSRDEVVNAGDFVVGSALGRSISLGPDGSRTMRVNVRLPAGIPAAEYNLLAEVDGQNTIAECDEENNVTPSDNTFSVLGPVVDLAGEITLVNLPARLLPGAAGHVALTIFNAGTTQITSTVGVSIYLSEDDWLDETDVLVGIASLDLNLVPGWSRSSAVGITLPASLAEGEYFLLAHIDAGNAVAESAEDNNLLVSDALEVLEPGLDLTGWFDTFDFADIMLAGEQGSARLAVTNEGNSPAVGEIGVQLYLSLDDVLDEGDLLLASTTLDMGGLVAGGVALIDLDVLMPDVPADSYFVLAKIDSGEAMAETDETNNLVVSDCTIDVLQSEYDLVGDIDEVDLVGPAAPGQSGHISISLGSLGNVVLEGSVRARLLLSLDDLPDASDIVLAAVDLDAAGLQPDAVRTFVLDVTVPADTADGVYTIILEIDSNDAVAELDKENNVALAASPLEVRQALPDLAAQFGAVSLSSQAPPGSQGSAEVIITNLGDWPASGDVQVKVYLSIDTALGDGDVLVGMATVTLSSLSASGEAIATVAVTVPPDMPQGSYVLLAQVDAADALAEGDEENNLAVAAGMIDVVQPADLIGWFASVSLGSVVGPEAAGQVTIAVYNAGSVLADGEVTVNVSVSLSGTSQWTQVGTRTMSVALSPDESQAVAVDVAMPAGAAAGQYVFRAEIVPGAGIEEGELGNNTIISDWSVELVLPVVDLLGWFDASLPGDLPTGPAQVGVVVYNLSETGFSGSFSIDVYMSADDELGAGDAKVGSTTVTRTISADGETTVVVNVVMPAQRPPAGYYLLADIDALDDVIELDETDNLAVSGLMG